MPTAETFTSRRVASRPVGLNPRQRRVAQTIIQVGQQMNAPRKVIKVALATWLTENPSLVSGGDRDSEGPFQQRPSTGWGPASESDAVDARQFYQHAIPLFHHGEKGGGLAQSVQRSAFPGRYATHLAQAGSILTKLEGNTEVGGEQLAGGKGAGGQQGLAGLIPKSRQVEQLLAAPPPLHDLPGKAVSSSYASTSSPMAAPVMAGQKGSLTSQLQNVQRQPNSSTPFQGRTQTVSEPLPASVRQALMQQLKASSGKGGQGQAEAQPAAPAGATGYAGKVRIDSGADRAGVSTSKQTLAFVRQVSALAGEPLTIGTGTNHSRLTVDGNVSDHWSGHAADIPSSGRALTRLGRLALIAAGANRKWAKRQSGGLFNINGHQIIFNTNEGGNHYTHLHVSV